MKIIRSILTFGFVFASMIFRSFPPGAGSVPEAAAEETLAVDVLEQDGRYVTWKENECYLYDGDIRFRCRDGTFTQALISFDGGKTYEPQFLAGSGDADDPCMTLLQDAYQNRQIVLKFRAEGDRESREFRLQSTGSCPGASYRTKDTFNQRPNVIN